MKKTTASHILTAVLTAVLILLASALTPVSAEYKPGGKPVTSEAEFIAMKSDGEYYLADDITINNSYMQVFTGTLNGNGKTITVSAPAFKVFNGTVRDLTIKGSVSVSASAGAFAGETGGMTAWNVVNYADVSCATAGQGGGLVGGSTAKAAVKFVGCINYGNVSATVRSGAFYAGGIIGCAATLDMYDCINYGKISSASSGAQVGGMCGYVGFAAGQNDAVVYRCSNYGEIVSAYNAGGMIADLGIKDNIAPRLFTFISCENAGSVSGTKYVGGIAGYGYGSECQRIDLYYCLNTGTVTGGDRTGGFVSHFFAYCNYAFPNIQGCLGCGTLKKIGSSTAYFCFFGQSSARGGMNGGIYGNVLAGDDVKWMTYALTDTNSAGRIPIEQAVEYGAVELISKDGLEDGSITMLMNRKLGANYFYQDLENGGLPTVRPEAGYVVYDLSVEEDKFVNGDEPRLPLPETLTPIDPDAWYEAPEPVETEPEETSAPAPETNTPETTLAQSGGCSGTALSAATVLACAAGCAAVLKRKKRENG